MDLKKYRCNLCQCSAYAFLWQESIWRASQVRASGQVQQKPTQRGGKQQGLLERPLGGNKVRQTGGRSVASGKTRPAAWPWALAWGPLLQRVIHTCVRLCGTPCTAAHQASLSFTVSQSLLKLMSILSVMLSNHLILCRPLLPLPSIFPSIE